MIQFAFVHDNGNVTNRSEIVNGEEWAARASFSGIGRVGNSHLAFTEITEPDEHYFEPDIIGALSDEAHNLGTYPTIRAARAAMEG